MTFLSINTLAQEEITWYNPQEAEFQVINGQAFPDECKGTYQRFPNSRKDITPKHVWYNALHSAGLYIKFYSNAPTIKVRYTCANRNYAMPHMPATGVSGLDLYANNCEGKSMTCHGDYHFGDTITYDYNNLVYKNIHQRGYEFELYLPLYNQVTWMEIGTPKDTEFKFESADTEKPILVYGTSIAHGGCASRPAMAWPAIVKRALDIPVINWGFSGSGVLDTEVFQQMSEVNAQLFILDNMPNMDHLPDSIVPRIVRGVRIVRQKQSAPILFVEHDGYTCDLTNSHFDKNRWGNPNKELREAFEQLRNEGVKDLYYLTKEELGLSYEAMVDNIHSTDYGMVQYANGYIPKIRQILHMPVGKSFLQNPIKQRREPNNYEWIDRHRAILKRNHEAQPDILMVGNSITHFWGGAPEYHNPRGQESWDKLFKGHTVTNMGYGWDRIENVLWRIYHGEFDGFKAKKIFMMLGTNNIGRCSDNELIDGINFIIPLIMERQPDATLYFVGIYPRRGKEAYVKALNEKLKASLPAYDRLKYINVNEAMLQKDGTLDESLFVGDGLHPNAEGYAKIAKLMKPYVNEK